MNGSDGGGQGLVRMRSGEIAGWIFRRTRRRFGAAAPFSLSFKVLQAILVTPIVAVSLRLLLQRWGRVSVGNFEIAAFLLSPPGIAAVVCIGTISLSCVYLELAGLMRLLAEARLGWWQALVGSRGLVVRLVRLGLRQLAFYLLAAIPFLAGIGLIYAMLWRGRDLNGLIVLKPAEFWWGAGLAGVLGAGYLGLAGYCFLRWLLAVPAMLYEPDLAAAAALRWSAERTAGQRRRILAAILLWLLVQVAVNALVLAVLRWGSGRALDVAGDSLAVALPVTAGLLIASTVVATQLAVFATLTFAGLVLAFYREAAGHALPDEGGAAAQARGPALGWYVAAALVLLAGVTSALSHRLLDSLTLEDRLEVTAHRAGAKYGPENSVAALRQAIRDRADWAEIDVQLTRDGALVILHDIDLARIGGGNKRVDGVTLAEIRELDIGSLFDASFAGERVPTLEEILEAAGHEIRMNVELKPHGKGDETELAERVVATIQKLGMVNRCRLCSQSYDSLRHAKTLEPSLPVGFITATSVGDITQLEVDFLMVKAELATRSLVERAGARNIPVHAWTVNDAAQLGALLDRGVANVITDDAVAMRGRLEEIRGLTPVERLLLRARSELTGASGK